MAQCSGPEEEARAEYKKLYNQKAALQSRVKRRRMEENMKVQFEKEAATKEKIETKFQQAIKLAFSYMQDEAQAAFENALQAQGIILPMMQ